MNIRGITNSYEEFIVNKRVYLKRKKELRIALRNLNKGINLPKGFRRSLLQRFINNISNEISDGILLLNAMYKCEKRKTKLKEIRRKENE